jgi:ABC-type phosphate/phosphonate transport system substrate-binding protein
MQRHVSSIRIRNLIISLAVFVVLVFYASTYSVPVLRVSVMPYESPPVLRRKLKPLTDYLEKKIGMKIEFRPMRDGDTLVDALLSKKLDMVLLDDVYFIQAKTRSNDQVIPLVRHVADDPLVQREADDKTQSGFITTPGYHDYSWTVHADMDVNLRIQLTDAFLALDRHNGPDKEILDIQHASKFIPAKAENYSVIEEAARRAGQTP